MNYLGGEENDKPMVILQLTDVIEERQSRQVDELYTVYNNDKINNVINNNNNNNNNALSLPSVLPSAPTLASNLPS